jgi:purine nucleosidase
MRKIIHDCDNTFGIQGCDVDDGLALLYLLGDPEAEVLGVTTTYGNNKLERVYSNTKKMLNDIGRTDIPVYKGGVCAGDVDSEAARYLAEMAEKYAGELEVLATGSLTNLYGAYTYNPDFFRQVKKIVLMGGITEPLIFAKRQMDELNFSCDPKATYTVLTSGADVSIATGNNCLKVLFTREEYEREFSDTTKKIVKFIKTETDYWFDDNMNVYGIPGYYNWDVIAAAYLMHPELFIPHRMDMEISEEHLQSGRLDFCGEGRRKNAELDLPEIGDESAFTKNIYQTWMNVSIE